MTSVLLMLIHLRFFLTMTWFQNCNFNHFLLQYYNLLKKLLWLYSTNVYTDMSPICFLPTNCGGVWHSTSWFYGHANYFPQFWSFVNHCHLMKYIIMLFGKVLLSSLYFPPSCSSCYCLASIYVTLHMESCSCKIHICPITQQIQIVSSTL
jgi:hypothetical protein